MAASTDFLPFATGGGANVEPQASYAADPSTTNGFSAGIAQSAKLNKVWRQSAFMSAVIANFVAQQLAANVPDDGNLSAAITNFTNALTVLIGSTAPGSIITTNNTFTGTNAFTKQISAPPVNLGNTGAAVAPNFLVGVNFYCVATNNFTLQNPTGAALGQAGSIKIIQDATGNRAITYDTNFVFPGGLRPALTTTPNAYDILSYLVLETGKLACILNKGFA